VAAVDADADGEAEGPSAAPEAEQAASGARDTAASAARDFCRVMETRMVGLPVRVRVVTLSSLAPAGHAVEDANERFHTIPA
jgi:hypothetical protein